MKLRKIALALVAAFAAIAAAIAIAAGTSTKVVTYPDGGIDARGVRPTGVGLPLVGSSKSIGAADLPKALRAYHDSGAYARDIKAVDRDALSYLKARLGASSPPAKPAIVLDIDETSLSNYKAIAASGFATGGQAGSSQTGTAVAIKPTLSLYRYARAHKVAVFFITGRAASRHAITVKNLKAEGYKAWSGLHERPRSQDTKAFKSGTRAAIEGRGFDIVANVGDQESDLHGGHADQAFKLPNPFYFIPD